MVADVLELWAGPECTVNRVGDIFGDQLAKSGHDERIEDLDLLAGLKIDAIRYPIIWEKIQPEAGGERDWRWADERLAKLQMLGIRPIAGLVHHGSGPRHTNLLADDFAGGLAMHARAAAERYPWITEWTPVNEPLTTARFAALYGYWYPHHRDERSFWLALLNQIDAVRLSMRAIREVIPAARLIQTDDLGRTYATAAMRDGAAFDNARRWMGWDLLCGRVMSDHPFWKRLCAFGFEDRLRAIANAPCPPDIIGINHYLTSDRFLDHRIHRYPPEARGGDVQAFADVEAVRVLQPQPPGFAGILREAWERYGIPLALTEVHNGCTREEQMRWTALAWATATSLREQGVDIRAVTAWSLFGSSGWDTLLTGGGTYETGIFDVRSGIPRPTAMVPLLHGLRHSGGHRHPVLQGKGWWTRPIRIRHPLVPRAAPMKEYPHGRDWRRRGPSPVLILGATGTLGQALAKACRHRDITHLLADRHRLDLSDPARIASALDDHRPWAVINAAGWVRVEEAEDHPEACFRANTEGALALAGACAERGIPCVSFSTDLVFDGRANAAYDEKDQPAPLGVYGASKAAMEDGLASLPGVQLIVRTAAFFSPFDPHNFAAHLAARLATGENVEAAEDHVVSPTYVPHLCDAVLDLLIDGETGIHHLTNDEGLSWADFARRLALGMGRDPISVRSVPGRTLGWKAPRPSSAALTSLYGQRLPPLDEAIRCFAQNLDALARSTTPATQRQGEPA